MSSKAKHAWYIWLLCTLSRPTQILSPRTIRNTSPSSAQQSTSIRWGISTKGKKFGDLLSSVSLKISQPFICSPQCAVHSKQYKFFKNNPSVQSPCSWGCMVMLPGDNTEGFLLKNLYCLSITMTSSRHHHDIVKTSPLRRQDIAITSSTHPLCRTDLRRFKNTSLFVSRCSPD